jgi:hypothetical protein
MPALYGITSNANVSVSNTTGLYIGSGNVTILNSAGTLLNLLSNAGTVGFYSTNSGTQVAASVDPSGVTIGTYGDVNNIPIVTVASDGRVTQVTTANVSGQFNFYSNANVAAYLPGYTGVVGFGGGNKLSGDGFGISIGALGSYYQGSSAIAIGFGAAGSSQGANAIAIGQYAGQGYQGQNAIAIGAYAGKTLQATNSIALIANSAITGSVAGPSISNSGLYVDPVRLDTGNVAQVLYYNNVSKEITYSAPVSIYSNANVASYLAANSDPTIQNLNANTQQQQTQINSISANLASFETYANVTYQTQAGSYGNANVAAYLPTYGGTVLANTVSSNGATLNMSGPAVQISGTNSVTVASGAAGSLNLTGHQIFVSGFGGSDTLTVQVPQTNQANLSMQSGYYINAERIIATGNVRTTANMISDNYLFANGVNILSTVSGGSGTYSNANVQAYLAANTDPTIQSLNANTAQQQAQINSINGNVTAANAAIQTLNANVGSFYTYANVTYSTIANAASQESEISGLRANITAANAAIQTISANVGSFYTWANANFSTTTYSNANVAAYLPTYTGAMQANTYVATKTNTGTASTTGAYSLGNLTFSDVNIMASYQANANNYSYVAVQNTNAGTLSTADFAAYNDSASYMDMGINSSGYTGTGNFSLPGAGYVYTGNTDLSIGTYGSNNLHFITNNAATDGLTIWANGNVATSNIATTGTISATGNITAPNLLGTAQYFAGDLHGNVIYDSTKYRFFANAYPLTTPDNTKYANGFTTWIVPTPVYTAGVVQAPAAGSGLATQGGQTLGAILSANVYIAPAGGAGNRSTNGHMAYTQVMPTGNMAGVDRSRGLFSQLDVNLNGTTWGTMGSASQASLLLCASAGTTQLLGSGSAAHAVGFNSVVAVAPTNGNIAVQYATGTYNFMSLASNSTSNGTTVQYARLVSGSVAGLSANLTINNMIGVHTASGWATVGAFTPTNRYTILNEDSPTLIQTNGNINLVSTATTGFNSTGVFTATALNAVTGVAGQFAAVSNGTAKNGGQMAYWDTTNNRWSWFDTNLAVS